jgi:hypothetical protein
MWPGFPPPLTLDPVAILPRQHLGQDPLPSVDLKPALLHQRIVWPAVGANTWVIGEFDQFVRHLLPSGNHGFLIVLTKRFVVFCPLSNCCL